MEILKFPIALTRDEKTSLVTPTEKDARFAQGIKSFGWFIGPILSFFGFAYKCKDSGDKTFYLQKKGVVELLKANQQDTKANLPINKVQACFDHIFKKPEAQTAPSPSTPNKAFDAWTEEFNKALPKPGEKLTQPVREKLQKLRITLFQETKESAKSGFSVNGEPTKLDPQVRETMQKGTSKFDDTYLFTYPNKLNPGYKTIYEIRDIDTVDMLKEYQDEGLRPVGLNLANAFQPGGGVEHGSGAQEESVFRRSNYHEALYPVKEKLYPIDLAQGIYTPSIQVFRTREKDTSKLDSPNGYQFHKPFNIDMIAVAAFDLRGKKELPEDFEETTKKKIKLILDMALEQGHDSIVLGALGCGAFLNPPEMISAWFKEALESENVKGRFKKVGFAIIYSKPLIEKFKAAIC